MTTYRQPVESGLSKASVDQIATSVAKQVGYEAGADLTPIVRKLGGSIRIEHVWNISDAGSGSIRIDATNKFEIALASHTGPIRDRFTIAHELGHYVLHFLWPLQQGRDVGPIEAKRYGSGRVEWEANWFAAGFLMPRDQFISAAQTTGKNIPVLASQFQVSPESARIRCETLGIA